MSHQLGAGLVAFLLLGGLAAVPGAAAENGFRIHYALANPTCSSGLAVSADDEPVVVAGMGGCEIDFPLVGEVAVRIRDDSGHPTAFSLQFHATPSGEACVSFTIVDEGTIDVPEGCPLLRLYARVLASTGTIYFGPGSEQESTWTAEATGKVTGALPGDVADLVEDRCDAEQLPWTLWGSARGACGAFYGDPADGPIAPCGPLTIRQPGQTGYDQQEAYNANHPLRNAPGCDPSVMDVYNETLG